MSVTTPVEQQKENLHERSGIVLNYEYNTKGQEPIDFSKVQVFNNLNRPKRLKHFCFLCKDDNVGDEKRMKRITEERMYFNLQRHWNSFHHDHPRVLQIEAALTKEDKKKLVDKLKNEGTQFFNHKFSEKTGKLQFVCSFFCFIQFIKNLLHLE